MKNHFNTLPCGNFWLVVLYYYCVPGDRQAGVYQTIQHPLSFLSFCAKLQKKQTNLTRKPIQSSALSTCTCGLFLCLSLTVLCSPSFLSWTLKIDVMIVLSCIAERGLGLPRGKHKLIYVMRNMSRVSRFRQYATLKGIELMPRGRFHIKVIRS